MIATMQPWHLIRVALTARPADAIEFGVYVEADPQLWACRQSLKNGLKFSVLTPAGEPVVCFGFDEDMPKVVTAWMISTDKVQTYVPTIKKAFDTVVADGVYQRFQALVRPDRVDAIKFVEWLGFTFEGACKKIAPNGDTMLLYAKT